MPRSVSSILLEVTINFFQGPDTYHATARRSKNSPNTDNRDAAEAVHRTQGTSFIPYSTPFSPPTQTVQNIASQVGDERPIAQVRFSPDSKLLATGSWAGTVKVWAVPVCELLSTHRGHSDRIGGVDWHPHATVSQTRSEVNLVSGAADGNVHLWSLDR